MDFLWRNNPWLKKEISSKNCKCSNDSHNVIPKFKSDCKIQKYDIILTRTILPVVSFHFSGIHHHKIFLVYCSQKEYVWAELHGWITFHKVEDAMKRAKKEWIPPKPRDLSHLGDLLTEFGTLSDFYQSHEKGTDGPNILIFMTQTMKKALNKYGGPHRQFVISFC